jgi:hypothetical protein
LAYLENVITRKLDHSPAIYDLLQLQGSGDGYDHGLLFEETGSMEDISEAIQKVFHDGSDV